MNKLFAIAVISATTQALKLRNEDPEAPIMTVDPPISEAPMMTVAPPILNAIDTNEYPPMLAAIDTNEYPPMLNAIDMTEDPAIETPISKKEMRAENKQMLREIKEGQSIPILDQEQPKPTREMEDDMVCGATWDQIEEVFNKTDSDNSGTISMEESVLALMSMYSEGSEQALEEIESMWNKVDTNLD